MISSYRERGLIGVFFFTVGFVGITSVFTMLITTSGLGYIMAFQSQPNPIFAWEIVCQGGESAAIAGLLLVPVCTLLEWLLIYRAEAG